MQRQEMLGLREVNGQGHFGARMLLSTKETSKSK